MPFTARDLRLAGSSFNESTAVRSNIKSSPLLARRKVFLSHSHLDKELVKGLVVELARLGVALYIDWMDAAMPETPTKETADRIKRKIGENDVFMLLATRNALNSKWVPWELGVADQRKGVDRIVIVPVREDDGFIGNEYVTVYQKLEPEAARGLVLRSPYETVGRSASVFLG